MDTWQKPQCRYISYRLCAYPIPECCLAIQSAIPHYKHPVYCSVSCPDGLMFNKSCSILFVIMGSSRYKKKGDRGCFVKKSSKERAMMVMRGRGGRRGLLQNHTSFPCPSFTLFCHARVLQSCTSSGSATTPFPTIHHPP